MSRIRCGSCGEAHGSVDEVRACHAGAGESIPGRSTPPVPVEAAEGPVEGAAVWSLDPGYSLPGESGPAGILDRPDGVGPPAADLDAEQLAAVAHEGPSASIIAPAGSGKTRVLTERARHLVNDWGVPAADVCLVAFNVRARAEMAERTADLSGLQVRTLNSLGLAVVRGDPPFTRSALVTGGPETIDEVGVRDLIGRLVKLPRRLNTDPAAAWLDAFAAIRLGLRDPAEVEREFGKDVTGLPDVFEAYRTELGASGVVDFDEQIYRALEVLLRDPAVRPAARRACRVLLVDEFQDLTPAHLLLIRLVTGPEGIVFGVGDDDQTIYGYTGADPEWLVEFDRFFPGAAMHALETNYRCPPGVVTAATNLLSRNRHRVAKQIRAASDRDDHDGFEIIHSTDLVATTSDRVGQLIDAGAAPSDVAVLTRVNATLAPVQIELGVSGVPTRGGVGPKFLDRTGVRGALAWVRLALDPGRLAPADLDEAVRRPSRGLSPMLRGWVGEQSTVEGLRRLAERLREDRDTQRVAGLAADIEALGAAAPTATTADLLVMIRDSIGLGATMDKLDDSRRGQATGAHGDDLEALLDMARLQPDPASFEPWLGEQLARRWSDEGVELATIHRVKGMEWPHVVVHGLVDGLLPHRLAHDREEERRILHVGITRSRRSTTVVASAAAPSPFATELVSPADSAPEPDPSPEEKSRSDAPRLRPSDPDDDQLRTRLREYRRDRSDADGVPAFVVLNDRTLDELVGHRPTTLEALGQIHGIGPAKIRNYGEEILEIIRGA